MVDEDYLEYVALTEKGRQEWERKKRERIKRKRIKVDYEDYPSREEIFSSKEAARKWARTIKRDLPWLLKECPRLVLHFIGTGEIDYVLDEKEKEEFLMLCRDPGLLGCCV